MRIVYQKEPIRDRIGWWLGCNVGYPTKRWARWRWVRRLADRWDPINDESYWQEPGIGTTNGK